MNYKKQQNKINSKKEVLNYELFGAVTRGDFKVIKQCFRLEADINWHNNILQNTPLMMAVMERDYSVVRLLLSMGASVNHKNIIEEDVFTLAEEYKEEDKSKMINLLNNEKV